MDRYSWFYFNGRYFTILAIVVLIHLILLFIGLSRNQKITNLNKSRPLKVKISHFVEQSKMKKQIVQSIDSPSSEKSLDSSFLSDKTRTFSRPTRARKVAPFHQKRSQKKLSLSNLGAFSKDYHPLKKGPHIARDKKENKQAMEENSSNDFVEVVALGDLTQLNTVEYKYYGFFHRIRQKLEQYWGRSIYQMAESLFKKGRKLAPGENLITSLTVTLSSKGEILAITLNGSSGIQELDQVAINSFNEAGPFPHPPRGLIRQGVVKIQWGFVVNPI